MLKLGNGQMIISKISKNVQTQNYCSGQEEKSFVWQACLEGRVKYELVSADAGDGERLAGEEPVLLPQVRVLVLLHRGPRLVMTRVQACNTRTQISGAADQRIFTD